MSNQRTGSVNAEEGEEYSLLRADSAPSKFKGERFTGKDAWEYSSPGGVELHSNIFASYVNLRESIANDRFDPDVAHDLEQVEHESHKLGQILATSIAGNDITSSCLYVVGIAVATAGKMAPISLVLVAILLYLFRNVYSEIGSALPLNGGAYNALLNTTSKSVAAIAACLTILSYIATAVVSASEACTYLNMIFSEIPIFWTTFAVLGVFAFLNLIGITESSVVAFIIFAIHLFTMFTLAVSCIVYMGFNIQILTNNWVQMGPVTGWQPKDSCMESDPTASNWYYLLDIYYGFSAALLGVSGFESSANYIEEQKNGVFPKTLRNMWAIVAVLNPTMAFLAISVLPYEYSVNNQVTNPFCTYENSLLAQMGQVSSGTWLNYMVSLDAFLVLSGATLTAYVGVTGLIRRMALDRCLPQFFLQENRFRHTNHWIILGFFAVTSSLYALVRGDVTTLSGMYSVAFLGVMALFAVGNMMLKYKRDDIPRTIRSHWITVLAAFVGVVLGLVGNVLLDFAIVFYFVIYFAFVLLLVMSMFARVFVMRLVLFFVSKIPPLYSLFGAKLESYAQSFKDQKIVFFAKSASPSLLNKALLYIRDNEQTNKVVFVHVYDPEVGPDTELEPLVKTLDSMYPKVSIDLILIEGKFTPAYVKKISEKLNVAPNFMFLACPDSKYNVTIKDFGGVRLITH